MDRNGPFRFDENFRNKILQNFILILRKFWSFLIISWSKYILKNFDPWPKDQNWSKYISILFDCFEKISVHFGGQNDQNFFKNLDRWPKDQNRFLSILILRPTVKIFQNMSWSRNDQKGSKFSRDQNEISKNFVTKIFIETKWTISIHFATSWRKPEELRYLFPYCQDSMLSNLPKLCLQLPVVAIVARLLWKTNSSVK